MAIIKEKLKNTCSKVPKGIKEAKDDNHNALRMLTATEMEIKYARHLADNDPKVRKRALKMLKKWFTKRGPLIDKDFSIVWSGLYVTFWMSDKPLVQEECAESIASLSNALDSRMALKFFESALTRLSQEWFGIDQLRMDKFLMLVRRLLRKALQTLAAAHYTPTLLHQYQSILTSLLNASTLNGTLPQSTSNNNLGLKLHVVDIYVEELAKTRAEDTCTKAIVTQLIKPFVRVICVGKDGRLLGAVSKAVFRQLMRQSELGLEFGERYRAWRDMGFPGGDISCMELDKDAVDEEDEDNEERSTERVLDPRAGRVNVELPQIDFDATEIADLLDKGKFDKEATSQNRKLVNKLIIEFKMLAKGEYPLDKKHSTLEVTQKEKRSVKKSADSLRDFEKDLYKDSNKNRKRKHSDTESNEEVQEETIDEPVHKSKKAKNKIATEIPQLELKTEGKRKKAKVESPENVTVNKRTKTDLFDKISRDIERKKMIRHEVNDEPEPGTYEWKFTRYSGTWFVFNGALTPTCSPKANRKNGNLTNSLISNDSFYIRQSTDSSPSSKNAPQSPFKQAKLPQHTLKCTKGDLSSSTTAFSSLKKTDSSKITSPISGKKHKATDTVTTPKNNKRTHLNDMAKSGEKKVKIDLKLNRSQEIHEHEMQIKRSPAIPYDANRMPTKPLLKSQNGRFSMSPINPFAKSVKQRRSLMF